MESISAFGLNMLGADQASQSRTVSGVGGTPSDVERFQQSMQWPGGAQIGVSEANSGVRVGTGGGETLGDKILNGLDGLKSGYDSQIEKLQTTLSGVNPLETKDMFRLQMDLAKLTLQGELINKTVTKSTQNLDTLLKSQ